MYDTHATSKTDIWVGQNTEQMMLEDFIGACSLYFSVTMNGVTNDACKTNTTIHLK